MRSRVGQRMPLTRTGVGMALLLDRADHWAALYEAEAAISAPARNPDQFVNRMRRYAAQGATFDLEDNEIGIRCVAAPVRGATGQIVAAISLSLGILWFSPWLLRRRRPARNLLRTPNPRQVTCPAAAAPTNSCRSSILGSPRLRSQLRERPMAMRT